jgi:dihydroorotate dehydrogenase
MHRLLISAPFGNYIQPRGATATLGTFTAARRPGRVWRILKTVRYYRRLGAWVNQIGLRNPGMDWLAAKVQAGKIHLADKIVSVHGFTPDDWWQLLDAIASLKPLAVELNMSCPNVGHIDWPPEVFTRAVATQVPVIVKLPPVRYEAMTQQAIAAGVRTFHCCNTLPVPRGGMSGKPLMPLALACIADLKRRHPDLDADGQLTLIGGGGITTVEDVDHYADAGVRHVALGTKVMHPQYLWSDAGIRPLIAHADARLGPR